jgi:HEAT repeat protein
VAQTRRRQLAIAFLALLGVAVLVQASLLYLPTLFGWTGYYDGRPARYWIGALKSPDVEDRRRAIHALGAIGAEAEGAAPALGTALLEDVDRGARIGAALALMKLGPAAAPALPSLIRALEDKDPIIRMDVVTTLLRMGRVARPAVPALVRALGDERNETNCGLFFCTIKEVVAVAVGHASAGTAEAVPALTELLRPTEPEATRQAAVRALGEVGKEASPAVPELRALLDDPSDGVRQAAAEALRKITAE